MNQSQIQISRKALLEAVKAVSKLKPSNKFVSTNGLLFEVKNGKLHVSATDLETTFTKKIKCDDLPEGLKFVADDRALVQKTLEKLKDNKITLSLCVDGTRLEILHTKGQLGSATFPIKDYPLQPKEENIVFETSFDELEYVEKANKFTSNDELRAALYAVNLVYGNGEMRIEATDSHRLYTKRIAKTTDFTGSVLIPKANIRFLVNGYLTVFQKGQYTKLENEDTIVIFKNSDAKFPIFSSVIRESNPTCLMVKRDDILEAIDIVSLAASNIFKTIVFNLNTFELTAKDEVFDKYASQKIDVDFSKRENEFDKIGFNYNFLSSVLKEIDDKKLEFGMDSPSRALQIETSQNEVFLVMPVMFDYGK